MAENKDKKVLNVPNKREITPNELGSAEHKEVRLKRNVPNLRFKEFEREWEENYVNEICNEFKSGKTIKADLILDVGKYPVFGGNGLRGYTSTYNHDGLFVLIGRQGALCGNVRSVIGKTYITEHAIAVNGNNKSDTNFLHYLFLQMDLGRFSDQSAQPGLAVNKLLKLKVITPRIDEQRKIADFLHLIDERIATQNKIIDKLESLIKGIRSKLYKDLLGKEIFLGDISDIYQPKTISSTELIDRGFPVYGANGIIGYYDQYNHEMEQICITCRGNTCGTINFSQQKSWITGNAMVVNTDNYKDIVDKRYLFHLLVDYNFNNIISGSGQPQIVRTPLEKIKIKLPIIDKQKQIAESLDSILQKIDIEKYSLSLLNSQKQYLLRQMFI
ncbi:restriction endonuclease subunit S [Hoylesella nanceiensis]